MRIGAASGARADHQQVAAAALGVELAHVAARRDLSNAQVDRLQIGPHNHRFEIEEIEELVVLIQRRDHHSHFAVDHVGGHGKLAILVGGPHRPAHDLAHEPVVIRPAAPTRIPSCAGIGGEGHGFTQTIGPTGQNRIDVVARGQRRNDGSLDQRIVFGRSQHEPRDRRQRTVDALHHFVLLRDLRGKAAFALEYQRPRHAARLFLVDLRQRLGVGDHVVLAAGALRDRLQWRAAGRTVRADGHGGDFDTQAN